ncbi:MAG TPA: alpha-amylase family glycosyl hydrolase [Phycisphaerales bacterium]|nr:alpha-amylase family glycosyl hydrolase [Phycisphaerales bacterium]
MPSKPETRSSVVLLGALAGSLCALAPAAAQDSPAYLQLFETSWTNIEARTPDIFTAGYSALWLPPATKASDGSPGYDPWDRFDLGTPTSPTIYGTEVGFRQMVSELHFANQQVTVDLIMNHNGGRSSNSAFIADGAWPGFYLPGNANAANFWGDFHNGQTQSENPGGANYNLWDGDLVGLIDINQSSNFSFIRHPVGANPQNIPPGLVRNRPNPANARLYPDRNLAPLTFVNTGRGGNQNWTVYPFNTADPMQGDPIAENGTGLLLRATQWLMDEHKVDGFRLDAAKHIPQWFWDQYWDAIVFNRRTTPAGQQAIPFSFVEAVDSNTSIQTYIRKFDGIGNRDALDLNEAGALRDIRSANGFGSWQNPINASVDRQDDGNNNGTQGVHHVYSHDNGSVGSGGSAPALPAPSQYALPQNAYALLRSGVPIIYYNGREMHDRFQNRGFWPREGNPTALGNLDANLTRLVQIRAGHARGDMFVLNGPGSDASIQGLNDVLIFERGNTAAANLLVGVNDRYDNGYDSRDVTTRFPPGTILQELSGTATDPSVDPNNDIPDTVTVGANGRVTIRVPRNANPGGAQHHRGYVAYGPAAPAGVLSVAPVASTLPPDAVSVPAYRRRLTPVEVVTDTAFELRLATTKAIATDANFDDFAVFRINQGFADLNGNGIVDQLPPGATVDAGYEQFLTQSSPISGPTGTGTTGLYRQFIDTTLLPEGFNYISIIAYRRRTDGGLPIFKEFRKVVYIDRLPPQATLLDNPAASNGNFEFRVQTTDRTVNAVHILVNVPVGVDPVPLCNGSNQATQYDRLEWRRNVGTLPTGSNSLTVVAFEKTGRAGATRYNNISITLGSGDVNRDGTLTIDDLYASWALGAAYQAEADMNRNGFMDANDRRILEADLRAAEAASMAGSQR